MISRLKRSTSMIWSLHRDGSTAERTFIPSIESDWFFEDGVKCFRRVMYVIALGQVSRRQTTSDDTRCRIISTAAGDGFHFYHMVPNAKTVAAFLHDPNPNVAHDTEVRDQILVVLSRRHRTSYVQVQCTRKRVATRKVDLRTRWSSLLTLFSSLENEYQPEHIRNHIETCGTGSRKGHCVRCFLSYRGSWSPLSEGNQSERRR